MKFLEDLSQLEPIILPEVEEDDVSFDKYEEISRVGFEEFSAEYNGEIDEGPHDSSKSDLGLVTRRVRDREGCYALLQVRWDQNWGRWMWSVEAAVEGAGSWEAAEAALLERYAKAKLEYCEHGAYRTFLEELLPAPATIPPTALTARLFGEISSRAELGEALRADDFPLDIELGEYEFCKWVSSTFDGTSLVNVFEVQSAGEEVQYLAVWCSDGGVVVGFGGPWQSLSHAEANFRTLEGWTRHS